MVEPDSKGAELLAKHKVLALTNEKERSILSYRTEKALLYGLSDVIPKYFYIDNSFVFKSGFQKMLVYGYNKNNLELITDFNGWSWDISKNDINYVYNLIYQNLLISMGSLFLDQWMNYNSSKIDFIKNIKIVSQGTEIFYWLCRILYLLEKDNDYINKCINEKCKKLNEILDKEKYFEKIKNDRLKLSLQDGVKNFGNDKEIITFIHYPPFYKEEIIPEEIDFSKTLKNYNIEKSFASSKKVRKNLPI